MPPSPPRSLLEDDEQRKPEHHSEGREARGRRTNTKGSLTIEQAHTKHRDTFDHDLVAMLAEHNRKVHGHRGNGQGQSAADTIASQCHARA